MIYDCFTDAAGNLFIDGQEEPRLRAVGFFHRTPCPQHAAATVQIGKPYGCDCGGTVLMGWRDWWPLPDEPHVPGLLIDFTRCPQCGCELMPTDGDICDECASR